MSAPKPHQLYRAAVTILAFLLERKQFSRGLSFLQTAKTFDRLRARVLDQPNDALSSCLDRRRIVRSNSRVKPVGTVFE